MLFFQMYRLWAPYPRDLPLQACCLKRTLKIHAAYLCLREEYQDLNVRFVGQPSRCVPNSGACPSHGSCQLLMLILPSQTPREQALEFSV